MGKFVADKIMVNLIPDKLKPTSIADKIREGGNYHAQEVELAIERGGKYHADSIGTVSNAQTQAMDNIVKQMIQANQAVNTRRQNEVSQELISLKAKQKEIGNLTTTDAIGAFKDSNPAKFEQQAITYAKSQMNATQYAQYVRAQADKKFAQDRLAAIGGESKKSPHGTVQVFPGQSMGITLGAAEKQLQRMVGDADREIQAALGDNYLNLYFEFLNSRTMQAEEDYQNYEKRINQLEGKGGVQEQLETESTNLQNQYNAVGSANLGEVKQGPASTAAANAAAAAAAQEGALTPAQKEKIEQIEAEQAKAQEFSGMVGQFGNVLGIFGAVAGQNEKTAKVMEAVAKIQMAVALYEQVLIAQKAATEGKSFIAALFGFGGRQGGIMNPTGYRSYSDGGVAKGPTSGYPAILHGREAVVPLPNGRSIPVDIGKGNMGTNNVSINVNMSEGSVDTQSDAEDAKSLGQAINAAVLKVIETEQRTGGLLGG